MAIGSLKNKGRSKTTSQSTAEEEETTAGTGSLAKPSTTDQAGGALGQLGGAYAISEVISPSGTPQLILTPRNPGALGQEFFQPVNATGFQGQQTPGVYGQPVADVGFEGGAKPAQATSLLAQAPGTQSVMGVPAGALPAMGVLAGAYTGSQQIGGIQNAIKGKEMSTPQEVALAPLTGGASLVSDRIGLTGHKSTKEYQAERRGALDPRVQEHYSRMDASNAEAVKSSGDTEGVWSARTDPTGKYVGQKWSWDAEKDIARQTGNYNGIIGGIGNVETFGEEWIGLDPEKQKIIAQRLLDADAYVSDKGDTLIHKDKKELAKNIYAEVVNGTSSTTATGKDGQPISVEVVGGAQPKVQQGALANNTKAAASPLLNSIHQMTTQTRKSAGSAQAKKPVVQEQAIAPTSETPEDPAMQSPLLNNPTFSQLTRSFYGQ